jgi:hypothetical protein
MVQNKIHTKIIWHQIENTQHNTKSNIIIIMAIMFGKNKNEKPNNNWRKSNGNTLKQKNDESTNIRRIEHQMLNVEMPNMKAEKQKHSVESLKTPQRKHQ